MLESVARNVSKQMQFWTSSLFSQIIAILQPSLDQYALGKQLKRHAELILKIIRYFLKINNIFDIK